MVNVDTVNGPRRIEHEKKSSLKTSGIHALKQVIDVGTKTFRDRSQHSPLKGFKDQHTDKSSSMPSVPVMSSACGICGKTSQAGVGGICGGCWSQFRENGVRIGNLDDFKQFTEAVSSQVSKIVTSNPENNALIDAVRDVVPDIFENSKAEVGEPSPRLNNQIGQDVCNLDNNSEQKAIPSLTSSRLRTDVQNPNLAISDGTFNESCSSMEDGPVDVGVAPAPRGGSSADRSTMRLPSTDISTEIKPMKLSRSKTLAFSETSSKNEKELQNSKQKVALQVKTESAPDPPNSKFVRAKTELSIKKPTLENEADKALASKQPPKPFARAMTRISASSQRQAKEKALRREKTMKVEGSDKVRYQPTTIIKESKDGDEKKTLSAPCKSSTNSLKRMKSNISYKRSKTEKNIVRRKQTTTANEHQDNAISKRIASKVPLLTKFEVSDEEEDEDDDVSKHRVMPKFAPREKLMVKGQNSSKNVEESVNRVKRIPESRPIDKPFSNVVTPQPVATKILSTMEKLQKYGVMGEDNNPTTKNKLKDGEYFDQPAICNVDDAILPSFPSNLENNQQENSYFDDKKGPRENKMLTETFNNKKEETSKSSIYFDKPLSLMGGADQSTESIDYTSSKLSLGKVFSRDLALASGESPLTIRKQSMYCDNDYESGGIYHVAKNFSMANGLRPFNDTFKNITKSVTFNSSLNTEESFSSSADDSSYTGGFFQNSVFSTEVASTDESNKENTFSYGQSYLSLGSGGAPTVENDSDYYTGGVFKVAPTTLSSVVKRSVPDFSEPLVPSLSDITGTEELNNSLRSVAKNAITESSKSENINNPVKQMNRLNKKRQGLKPVDFFIEKSIESAGDFFSKTIMSFRPTNFNNSSSDWFDNTTGPTGSFKYNQDRLKFSPNDNEYTEYEPGFKPCCARPVPKPKNEIRLPDYQKYDAFEGGCCSLKVKEARSTENTGEWYAGTDDDFYGPTNVTWDGRDWPGKTSLSNSFRGNQEFEQESYQSSLLCEKYNMNNNYPDYNKYQESNMQKERREPPPPPPRGNDADYAPCLYANCPGERVTPQREVRKEPAPKPKTQAMGYYNQYFNPGMAASVSSYDDEPAEYAGYEPREARKPEIPSPPPVPKVIQVGHIVVRNNVECDTDYAENINRDIGTVEPVSSNYGGNSDSYSDDYQTGIPDQASFDHDRETLSLAKSVKKALAAAKSKKNTCGNNSVANTELLSCVTPRMTEKSLASQTKLVKGGPRELGRPELTKASVSVKTDHQKPAETTENHAGKGNGNILTWPFRKLGILGK